MREYLPAKVQNHKNLINLVIKILYDSMKICSSSSSITYLSFYFIILLLSLSLNFFLSLFSLTCSPLYLSLSPFPPPSLSLTLTLSPSLPISHSLPPLSLSFAHLRGCANYTEIGNGSKTFQSHRGRGVPRGCNTKVFLLHPLLYPSEIALFSSTGSLIPI